MVFYSQNTFISNIQNKNRKIGTAWIVPFEDVTPPIMILQIELTSSSPLKNQQLESAGLFKMSGSYLKADS